MSTKQCRDLKELHPMVAKAAEVALEECNRLGLNIAVTETYRTKERQDYIYEQGRSRPGGIVTNARGSSMSSYHQWRLALDIHHNEKDNLYPKDIMLKAAFIFKKYGFEWGGDWTSFKETPHMQMTFGLSIKDLQNGKKPPQAEPLEKDEAYEKAVQILVIENIIGSPAAWLPKPLLKNVEALIYNIGRKLEISSYEGTIKHLSEIEIGIERVINEEALWLHKNYNENHVKWLIRKLAAYLG